MLRITNGRHEFCQWDIGQSLTLSLAEGESVSEVHIGNDRDEHFYVVEPKDNLVAVYDELLQSGKRVIAYEYVLNDKDGHTIRKNVFNVARRPKADEYEYTPTQSYSWEWWCERAKMYAESAKADANSIPAKMSEWWESHKDQFHGKDGDDGISPVATVTPNPNGATITVTDKDGTTTAVINNGRDGEDGEDGISPTAKVEAVSNGAKITITDKSGTTTANVTNGSDYVITEADKTEIADEVEGKYTTELTGVKESIRQLVTTDKWNLAEVGEVFEGQMCNNGSQAVGTPIKLATFGSGYTIKCIVPANEYLYFVNETFETQYGSTGYNGKNSSRFLCFADADDNFISGFSYPKSETGIAYKTPSNVKYAYVTFIYKNGTDKGSYWITTNAEGNHYDSIDLSDNVQSKHVINSLVEDVDYMKGNVFEPVQSIRKPTFIFTFDDGTNGDINVKELFDSYGFKCAFAIISNVNIDTVASRYLSYQAEGYEVLSHSVDATAMETIDTATAENKMRNSLNTLKQRGFMVDGFVTPSTWLSVAGFTVLKKYYQYGFGHLVGSEEGVAIHSFNGKDVRQLDRWSLESNTVESTISKINECISQNGVMIFYGHSYPSTTNNMTVANMNTILDYLKSKVDNDEIVVDTPRKAINNYYAMRHSDYLALL